MEKVQPSILKSKAFKELKKAADKEFKNLLEILQMYSTLQTKIYKRCMLEGCRYGYPEIDKEPGDKCIYCETPNVSRNNYFNIKS